jgi:hypothetical protein
MSGDVIERKTYANPSSQPDDFPGEEGEGMRAFGSEYRPAQQLRMLRFSVQRDPRSFSPEMSARNIDTIMRYRDVSCITRLCDGRAAAWPGILEEFTKPIRQASRA